MGTLLLKDKLDDLEAAKPGAWAKAKEAFWQNIGKYTEVNMHGELIMPQNTFRLTVATKPKSEGGCSVLYSRYGSLLCKVPWHRSTDGTAF